MLARDTSCLWCFQNTKERSLRAGLYCGTVCAGASFSFTNQPPQGAHREESWVSQVEQPQAFSPPLFEREGGKQLDRGIGWLVMPGCVHKGHAEPESQ